ncbi:toprim domain-containing protein [Phenylobacterium sp.]|uniref:toprim domain-containing protein n=1 Tax=Phenylobacterium sp. TaxID=1871053 RepID=UPI0025F7E97A|nr:toprim domain-containing protein [Phenylobacterium sp.]
MPVATTLSLIPLARALGGDVYAGGRRALAPAPGHGATDRSVSLVLIDGRVVVHSFGAADWREVLDDLRARGWIDGDNRLLGGGGVSARPPRPERSRAERERIALALWEAAVSVAPDGPAAAYGRSRGVDLCALRLSGLRAHGAVPTQVYADRGLRLAGLLAGVRDADGAITAVEVTYLDARGERSRLARPPRKVVGSIPAGAAVRLVPRAAEMLVAEGVFTTLSAMARFGLPGWALLSTSNLRRWSAPQGVRRVLIAGDRGPDGERSAGILCARLRNAGVLAEVVLPPVGAGDWNDLARREDEEGRRGAPGSQGWSLAAGRDLPHGHDPIRS